MTKKELKKEYKQNKKNLKKEFKENKKHQKEEYVDRLVDCVNANKEVVNPPYRSALNEIGNGVSHGVGAIFAIIVFILMIIKSDTLLEYISAIVYSIGIFILFLMSCLYHCFPYGSTVKRVFRKFDYSSIYILIGATYTPILLNFIGGMYGIIFCILQWLIIIIGITFVCIFGPNRIKWLNYTLYILLGWCGIILFPNMLHTALLWYILIGGIIYMLGIIPFALNKKSSHFIWHIFVLLGAVVQWLGVYLYIYL